jgi:murein L,D-transpeptidase YcbB/YkuD
MKKHLLSLCVLLIAALPVQAASLRQALETLLPDNGQMIAKLPNGETLFGKFFMKRMYEATGYELIWTPASIRSLTQAINGLAGDGLTPSDYIFAATRPYIENPNQGRGSAEESALIDVLLTEGYLRALYQLYYGKADPQAEEESNNFGQARDGKDRSQMILAWAQKNRIDEAFGWARPKSRRYDMLREGLAQYRSIKAAGGWPQIPNGPAIKPGDSDPRIVLIRKRLSASGDLPSATGPNTYDAKLQEGVKRFQYLHGLASDGTLGPGTIAAMNVSVDKRIEQIRANLDRQRWILHEEHGEFLAVDIAGFMIYWYRDGKIIWSEDVQVGKAFTNTPIFKDRVRYIDFNPTWTIPPGILKRTVLPELKKNPGYLGKMGYKLLSRDGKELDPHSIDWKSMSSIPYSVVQEPGDKNALGRVKFMFPNKYSVFLHDTNHRELFAKQVRTTSSGCIRLKSPFDLAERLLAGQGWNRARIDKVLASGKTTRVNLEKPMRILIFYSTAFADEVGVHFKDDIYKRDPRVLAQLNGPFRFHLQDTGGKPKPGISDESYAADSGSDNLTQATQDAAPVAAPTLAPAASRKAAQWNTGFLN